MHRFLHGIRRSSCWPVASPLAFARLPCLLPFPTLNQPSEDGDLLQIGDETDNGDLLPQSGDEDEDGDLQPQSGEANGKGIPLSQENAPVVLCDRQPPIKWKPGNNLGILTPTNKGVASTFATVLHDAVLTLSLSVARPFVFDPGGFSCLCEEVLFDCQPASITSHRQSLWLNGRNSRESAATHFLIPLRGSISMQWNDEDFDEDAAALKKKTKRRMMVLRLLYLMKDLFDPG